MSGWQPIETAPKDGTQVLLYYGGSMVVAWWGDYNAADSEFGTVPHNANWGWLMHAGQDDPVWFRQHPYATHWAPLPDPPKSGT